MLAMITKTARVAFRDLDAEAKEEAVAEVVAAAFIMFVGLVERGREALAYGSVLANFGVKRVKIGRKAATPMNVRDISSEYSQLAKGLSLQRLDRFDTEENAWREVVVEDHRVGPAEVVATKLDFESWLRSLPRRTRKIAAVLAAGETTTRTAKRFKVSAGRISQMRRELMGSWCEFVGDAVTMGGAVGAVA
jgi:hypothetical protein